MPKKKTESTRKYLHDKVLNNIDQDRFGHKDLSNELLEIINEQDTPLNIGIFGKWGVGKSSIVSLLEDNIGNSESSWKFIKTNVWKYENDNSIRRKLMFDIADEIDHLDLINKFYSEVELGITKSLFPKKWYLTFFKNFFRNENQRNYFILLILALWTIAIISKSFSSGYIVFLVTSIATTISIAGFSLPVLFSLIQSLAPKYTRKVFEAEEQFESLFINTVNKFLTEKSLDKLIIFIDDLDRCSPSKVIKTLEAVKTFLNIEGCVFIIACDPEIIKKAVIEENNALGYTEADGGYYLEKFFQHTITVAPFLPDNMREFAERLITDNKLSIANDLDKDTLQDILFILAYDANANPRGLIVLINSFISDFYIAKTREQDPNSTLLNGQITVKPQPLAILTVLKNDFPFAYRQLLEHPRLIEKIWRKDFKSIQDDSIASTYNTATDNRNKLNGEISRFIGFVEILTVSWINISISPYIHLTTDKSYSKLDNIIANPVEFEEAVRNKNIKYVLNEIKSTTEQNRLILVEFVGLKIDSLRNSREKSNAAITLSHILKDFDFSSISKEVQHKIALYFRTVFNKAHSDEIKDYDQAGLFEIFKFLINHRHTDDEYLRKVLSQISPDNSKWLDVLLHILPLNNTLPTSCKSVINKFIDDHLKDEQSRITLETLSYVVDFISENPVEISQEIFYAYFSKVVKNIHSSISSLSEVLQTKIEERNNLKQNLEDESIDSSVTQENFKKVETVLNSLENRIDYAKTILDKLVGTFDEQTVTSNYFNLFIKPLNENLITQVQLDYINQNISNSPLDVKLLILNRYLELDDLAKNKNFTRHRIETIKLLLPAFEEEQYLKPAVNWLENLTENQTDIINNEDTLKDLLNIMTFLLKSSKVDSSSVIDSALYIVSLENRPIVSTVLKWVYENITAKSISEDTVKRELDYFVKHIRDNNNSKDITADEYSIFIDYIEWLLSECKANLSEYFVLDEINSEEPSIRNLELIDQIDFKQIHSFNRLQEIGENRFHKRQTKNIDFYLKALKTENLNGITVGYLGIHRQIGKQYLPQQTILKIPNFESFINRTSDYPKLKGPTYEILFNSETSMSYLDIFELYLEDPKSFESFKFKRTYLRIGKMLITYLKKDNKDGVEYKKHLELLYLVFQKQGVTNQTYSKTLFDILSKNLRLNNHNNLNYVLELMSASSYELKPVTKKDLKQLLIDTSTKYKRARPKVTSLNDKFKLMIPKKHLDNKPKSISEWVKQMITG